MVDVYVKPSRIAGTLTIPSSKSHTLRALLFASLAKGTSKIHNYLPSPDTQAMIHAVTSLGAKVTQTPSTLTIHGVNGQLSVADDVIQCGNSGIVLRFIGALAGLIPAYTILTGDASIRHQRLADPLLQALNALGAFASSARGDGYAPLIIKGPWIHSYASLEGQDSQPVSGLLIAGAFSAKGVRLNVTHPGEKPWIDLTLYWFDQMGLAYHMEDYTHYYIPGSQQIKAFEYTVPGDFSTAAFPITAALLTQSELTLLNMNMNDIQGDKQLIPLLQKMGASFSIDPITSSLTVHASSYLKGGIIDVNHFIDALPILAVIGCFAKGTTTLTNASIARTKESDRIHAIATELKKMGANIEERTDGLVIHHSDLHGATLNTYHDHRIALSLIIAAMVAKGPSVIQGIECTTKTYPNFIEDFTYIGAKIQLCPLTRLDNSFGSPLLENPMARQSV